jgi:hypothetical protein
MRLTKQEITIIACIAFAVIINCIGILAERHGMIG